MLEIGACTPKATTSAEGKYSEDLSVHRLAIESPSVIGGGTEVTETVAETFPDPRYDITKQLNSKLDSINRIKAGRAFLDGYTIQVYSGTSQSEAKIARGKIYSTLKGQNPSLTYDEPNFKVKVGEYYTRLEAQKTYTQIKHLFPGSIITPTRITIK